MKRGEFCATSPPKPQGPFTGAISKYHDSTSRQRLAYLKPFCRVVVVVLSSSLLGRVHVNKASFCSVRKKIWLKRANELGLGLLQPNIIRGA